MIIIDEYDRLQNRMKERRRAEKRVRKEARILQLIAQTRLTKAAPVLLKACERVVEECYTACDEIMTQQAGSNAHLESIVKQVKDAIRIAKER